MRIRWLPEFSASTDTLVTVPAESRLTIYAKDYVGIDNFSALVQSLNNQPITVERFEQEMARRGGNLPGQYQTLEQRQTLLQEIIEFEGLAAAARLAGYDSDPETLAIFNKILVARFQGEMLEPRVSAR